MNRTDHEERAEELLERTLQAVAGRRHAQRQRRVVGGAVLVLLVVALGGLLVGDDDQQEEYLVRRLDLPRISLVSHDGSEDQVPLAWGEPWSLLLVMDERGVEMKTLSAGQISALARKPGCKFVMSPEAMMIVSDSAPGAERFEFSDSF